MKITVEMPRVGSCSATECAYNRDAQCHAKAITIGDGTHPGCDTFTDGDHGRTRMKMTAGVGACKVTGCSHNSDLECTADRIEVARNQSSVDCITFSPR